MTQRTTVKILMYIIKCVDLKSDHLGLNSWAEALPPLTRPWPRYFFKL